MSIYISLNYFDNVLLTQLQFHCRGKNKSITLPRYISLFSIITVGITALEADVI
jgi:hypothetical protein